MFPAIQFSKPRFQDIRIDTLTYLSLPDDGFQYELVEGGMRIAPSGSFHHGELQLRFGHLLSEYLGSNPIGRVSLETDMIWEERNTILRPDISFVSKDRLSIIQEHISGPPELVIEILSLSNRSWNLGKKAELYLYFGVLEYWIVDPSGRSLQVWRNRNGEEWKKDRGAILESEILPRFRIQPREFFCP
ncbi:Uma2 family endonuclease [Leptospira wolffii]|uniref:Uma2 family endonuclease n=1 Tax=Leptospira wolffii TaxID=409998 RepID=UPI0010846107|nr:Uma2 family endonuclease [Leptospira wolffii]TGK56198.1 Uma2 family endonuclease [Leptospira wolffii]TGK72245.1 Uma2 family endonuclease [Leptospira wolffii]TGK72849.1 Uma2 family endonuclease [Leptospira wolffii]TGL27822.1 Uma2 family endonuclease [Leptospira wolffii]